MIVLTVSDGAAIAARTVVIDAVAEAAGPDVRIELTPSFPVIPGQEVILHPIATSRANIVEIVLSVDGQPIDLDPDGRARIHAGDPGKMEIVWIVEHRRSEDSAMASIAKLERQWTIEVLDFDEGQHFEVELSPADMKEILTNLP